MTIGSMFTDILNSFFRKPVTEKYPFTKVEAPEDLRGKVIWDASTCTGCGLCVKDCPSGALELFTVDKINKHFVMLYHVDRCTYCAQCEVSCRSKSISLSDELWELASTTRTPFEVYYGRDDDVKFVLDQETKEESEPSCEDTEE